MSIKSLKDAAGIDAEMEVKKIENNPKSLDKMTKDEFNAKMTRALFQAKSGEGMSVEEFFSSLKIRKYQISPV